MYSEDTTKNTETNPKVKIIVLFGALSFLLTGAVTGIPAVFMGHRELSKNKKYQKYYQPLTGR